MKQSEISKWLKGITIAVAIMGVIFFVILVPKLADMILQKYQELAFLYIPGLIYSGLIALLCYILLFQFWKVSCEIGKDNSFSLENARAFKIMSRISIALACVWFIALVVMSVFGWIRTGALLVFIFAVLCNVILSIITAALSHLIWKAYEMKQENELTI